MHRSDGKSRVESRREENAKCGSWDYWLWVVDYGVMGRMDRV